MSTTTEDIFNEIIQEKESGAYPELSELNSESKASVWRLMIWIFSFFSQAINELFDSFKSWIESVFAKNQHGTLLWWVEKIKAFQYGDLLVFIDSIWKYELIDKTKQIVKQVALETVNYVLLFKVASEDSSGNLTPLTTSEKTALHAYIDRVKFPGTHISVVSELPDDLKLKYKIYYNAELPENELEEYINQAASDYLKNIVFNGKFSHTELTDKLQAVDAVVNPVFVEGYGKPHALSVNDYIEITDYYTAASGYFTIADLKLEFIPNV